MIIWFFVTGFVQAGSRGGGGRLGRGGGNRNDRGGRGGRDGGYSGQRSNRGNYNNQNGRGGVGGGGGSKCILFFLSLIFNNIHLACYKQIYIDIRCRLLFELFSIKGMLYGQHYTSFVYDYYRRLYQVIISTGRVNLWRMKNTLIL